MKGGSSPFCALLKNQAMLSGLNWRVLSNLNVVPSLLMKMMWGVQSPFTPISLATSWNNPVPSSLLETAVIRGRCGLLSTNLAKEPNAKLSYSSSPNSNKKPPLLCLKTYQIVLLSKGMSQAGKATAKKSKARNLFMEAHILGIKFYDRYDQYSYSFCTFQHSLRNQSCYLKMGLRQFPKPDQLVSIFKSRQNSKLYILTPKMMIIGLSKPNVPFGSFRKFLMDTIRKEREQMQHSMQEQGKHEDDEYFQSLMSPQSKTQCDQCRRDISNTTRVFTQPNDYCPSCFANLEPYPPEYQVMGKLDFPLFDIQWTAQEQLFLLKGLEEYGFGNWQEIADFIATNKKTQDVEQHYYKTFLANEDFMPSLPLLSKRHKQGGLQIKSRHPTGRSPITPSKRLLSISNNDHPKERGSLTVQQRSKVGTNPAAIIGYMPKRGDFQVEFDNNAQLLLAQMEFNDYDTPQQISMKFGIIDIYNQRLNQRVRRKQFAISRGLLDLNELVRLDRTRTKEQKEVNGMLKVFARFNTAKDHQKLVQAVLKERQISQRIEELKAYKKKGLKTLTQIAELETKTKRQNKTKRQDAQYTLEKTTYRRIRNDPIYQKNQMISRQEEQLCRRLSLAYSQYVLIRQGILRESIRLGRLSKDFVFSMFRLQQYTIQQILDYLASEGLITIDEDERRPDDERMNDDYERAYEDDGDDGCMHD